jgi:adenylyltransferase/sulfurtransferase
MPEVTVELPSLLGQMINGEPTVAIEASTLREALRELVRVYPEIEVHLFDESGGFREHVLCFHNDTNTRWLDVVDVALADGDRISIIQAVSGG